MLRRSAHTKKPGCKGSKMRNGEGQLCFCAVVNVFSVLSNCHVSVSEGEFRLSQILTELRIASHGGGFPFVLEEPIPVNPFSKLNHIT